MLTMKERLVVQKSGIVHSMYVLRMRGKKHFFSEGVIEVVSCSRMVNTIDAYFPGP